jgi:hypothetical protein
MNHFALPRFWKHYNSLPQQVQQLADKNYALLRSDPFHPSLHFKKVGKDRHLWSVRVGDITAHWVWTKAKASFGFGSERTLNTTKSWRNGLAES